MSHSKFPWSIHPQVPTNVFDADGMKVATTTGPNAEDNAALIVRATSLLRASAVAEPVGYICSMEISNRFHLGLSVSKMGAYDLPVYTHPAPAAPVPASVRETLEKIAGHRECDPSDLEKASKYKREEGLWTVEEYLADVALASLPAPEAAPTPEEIAKPIGFMDAMNMVDRGFDTWKDKPHNAKWYARIDGTPIPNDLKVNIAEAICHYLALKAAASK